MSRHIPNFLSSVQKKDTPKVNMEARRHKWLEFKGKTKNAQRIDGFGPPVPENSYFCEFCKKTKLRLELCKTKKFDNNQGALTLVERVPYVTPRNLFNHGDLVDPEKEDQNLAVTRKMKEKFEVSIDMLQ